MQGREEQSRLGSAWARLVGWTAVGQKNEDRQEKSTTLAAESRTYHKSAMRPPIAERSENPLQSDGIDIKARPFMSAHANAGVLNLRGRGYVPQMSHALGKG